MALFVLILAITVLLITSYFIITDGKEQLDNYDLGDLDDDDDDPKVKCWDDDKAHTEGKL